MQQISLSPTKLEFIVVTNKRLITRPQLLIGSDLIKEVSSFKYLGVYIDTRLKCSAQINYLKSKLSQLCGVSFRLSKLLNYEAARNMYHSYTYSVSQCTSRCDGLKPIHKKIVKNLFMNFFQNNLCIFRQTRILKLDHTYRLNVASYRFNTLKQEKYLSKNYHARNSNEMLLP